MNHTSSPASVVQALQWRYATKKFDPSKKISAELWSALEKALVLAPSSCGLQPWKFVVVQDPAVKQKLSAAANGQTQPIDCSHYVVFAYRKNLSTADVDRLVKRAAEVRGVAEETLDGFRGMVLGVTEKARSGGYLDVWMSRQVYIALGQFMAAASLLGVDTCPMEGIDPAKFDDILGLPAQGYATLCTCAAGYRAADDKYASFPKVRFAASEVVAYV